MGFNKALAVKRFSIDNWIDYGRAKYYLEKNNYDIPAATKQYNSELVQNKDAKDLTLSKHLRIVKQTSKESMRHILWPGDRISVEGDNEIVLLREGDEGNDKEMKMDELIRTLPKLDVGKAKFFLDKCNWNLQVAQNLAESDDIEISSAAEQMKKYPSQYIDIVDDQVVCRYHEDTGPEPESELELFYALRERYQYLDGETVYVLKKAEWSFDMAIYFSDLYIAYKKYGTHHFEFREKMDEFINSTYKEHLRDEPLKEIVQRMDEDSTFDRDLISQLEFYKSYKLFKEKTKVYKDDDIKMSFDFLKYAAANPGEDVPLAEGHKIHQGENLPEDIKLLAFTYWTSTDNITAKRILDKVGWNMLDAFKLDDCIKNTWKPGHKRILLELAREYFGDIQKFKDLQDKLEDSPRSIERAEAEKLASEHFKGLRDYELFLDELFGRTCIEKAKVLKKAEESFKNYPKELFKKELRRFPSWIDFDKALELAEKCFSKDYEDFLIELLYPPYLDTERTKKLAEEYFEMHKDYKVFLKKINEQPDDISAEDIKKVAEEFFKDREDFKDLLTELLNLPIFDKEKAIKIARKHFRSNMEYEHFMREIKKHSYSIKTIDAWKLADQFFKDREGYKMFYVQLLSPREVQKDTTLNVARKYYGFTTQYENFVKDVDGYTKQFGSQEAKQLASKHFNGQTKYRDLEKELEGADIDKETAKSIARKYYGFTKEFKNFKKDIDSYSKEIDGEDYRSIVLKHFKETKGCVELSKELRCHTILDKETAKDLARKHCGYTEQFINFKREVNEGFNRIQAKRLGEKYFYIYKNYRPFMTALESEDIDKKTAKFLAEKYFGGSKECDDFLEEVKKYPDAFRLIHAKKIAMKYFKDHENYEQFLHYLRMGDVDKKRAKNLAEKYFGDCQEYEKFVQDVKDYPETFGRRHAKELAKKYFEDLKFYENFCLELDRREIDKERAKRLIWRYFVDFQDYEKSLRDIDADIEGFGITEAKMLALRYFKDHENFNDLRHRLSYCKSIDKEAAINLAEKYCGDAKEYEDFKREINEGFNHKQAKELAKKYFGGHKNYKEFCEQLDKYTLVKKAAKDLAEKYFRDCQECKFFIREVNGYLDNFGVGAARKLTDKYFKDVEGYGDLTKELEVESIDRERALFLAETHCGYTKKYKTFELEINKYTQAVASQDVMKLVEKHFKDLKDYDKFLDEMFSVPHIETERAKFLAKLYFGSHKDYENFEKDIIKYTGYIGSQNAKKLAEKYFKNYTGYRKFSKELPGLTKYLREEKDQIVTKYFQDIKEYRKFAEEIRNLPNSICEEEAKKLTVKYFKCMQGLGKFWIELSSLPYIDRERATKIARKHFGSHKPFIAFKEEMQQHPNGIEREKALEVVERHFKELEHYRDLVKELDSHNIDKETAKFLAGKYFGCNRKYINFVSDVNNYSKEFGHAKAKELVDKHFKENDEYSFFESKIRNMPRIIESIKLIKLAQSYFEQNQEYEAFEKDVENLPSLIEKQKFEKLNISQVIRCLSIWTGLDYGQLIHVYRSEEDKLLWPTMKKLAAIKSKYSDFRLDNYFLLTDLLTKEVENIVADIPRFGTKMDDVTRLKGRNNVTTDIIEGRNETRTDELVENSSGFECIPVDLDLALYKNGVLFDGGMFQYDSLVNLRKALRGDRPFKPGIMDKEIRYNFQDRMTERCPIEKLNFYLKNFYTQQYEKEDKEEAERAEKAAAAERKAAAEEKAKINQIIEAAVAAAAAETEVEEMEVA